MPSVQPITVSDLNGIEFNPKEIVMDDVVGYIGYVRNLCTDIGTPRDTKEGYKDFQDFQADIRSTNISTFEPDAIDVDHTFEAMDLTGINYVPREYPLLTYFDSFNNLPLFSYENPITPFDLPATGTVIPTKYVTPFDFQDINLTDEISESDKLIIT
jgi:hypothetical protein